MAFGVNSVDAPQVSTRFLSFALALALMLAVLPGTGFAKAEAEEYVGVRATSVPFSIEDNLFIGELYPFSGGYSVIECYFEDDDYYSSSVYGLFDRTGKLVLPVEYEYIGGFRDGLALICER